MTMTDDDSKDQKVKALVEDPTMIAQLEAWFGRPSFAQVEAGEVSAPAGEAIDPEVQALQDRRKRVLDEVDKKLLASIESRITPPDDLIKFTATIEPRDKAIALFDTTFSENRAIAEERWYERPEDIRDALEENAPQALLRDLHRPETDFDRNSGNEFENFEDEPPREPLIPDVAKQIDEVFRERYKLQPVEIPDMSTLLADSRFEIRSRWTDILQRARLINRRVTE